LTYTFLVSSALAVLVAILVRVVPPRSVQRSWVYAIPVVVPVVSYVVNYVIIGKACEYSQSDYGYIGFLRGFPSYHLLCRFNRMIAPWVAQLSLAWLAVSLSAHALAWWRRVRLQRCLLSAARDDARAKAVLDNLCEELDIRLPELRVIDYPGPLMFAGGTRDRVITVSTGALDLLEDNELRAAFAHELAHIRRSRNIINRLVPLCRNLTLFSPAALWSYEMFRAEEEQACDAMAAAQTGLGVELASAIVKFMYHATRLRLEHSVASLVPVLLPRGNPAIVRVRRLLDGPDSVNGLASWIYSLLFLLAVGMVFVC
jgi:Zn-dependent protease with chaperone function